MRCQTSPNPGRGTELALILRRRFESRDVWMTRQELRDRATQRSGAVAVDYAYFAEAIQENFVEKLVCQTNCFVGLLADQIEFSAGGQVFASGAQM